MIDQATKSNNQEENKQTEDQDSKPMADPVSSVKLNPTSKEFVKPAEHTQVSGKQSNSSNFNIEVPDFKPSAEILKNLQNDIMQSNAST